MIDLPEVIKTYVQAYNTFDVLTMLACLSDNVVFQNLANGEVTAQANSKEEFAVMAKMSVSAFEKREQTPTHAISVGNTTHVEIDYTATVAVDLPNGWKAGQELSFQGRSSFELKDNKIIKLIDAA